MRYLLFFILPVIYSALVLAPFFGIEHWAYTQEPFGLISPWNVFFMFIGLIMLLSFNKKFLEIIVQDNNQLSPVAKFLHFASPIVLAIYIFNFSPKFNKIWLDIIPDLKAAATMADFELYAVPPYNGIGFILVQIFLILFLLSSVMMPVFLRAEES